MILLAAQSRVGKKWHGKDEMLKKPVDKCSGCPLYGDGEGFVPDHITNGPLTILAQNPGVNEEKGEKITSRSGDIERVTPQPLIGKTGYDLTTKYLPLTGVSRDNISLCNVLKCRWNHTNDMPTGDTYVQAIRHCTNAHLKILPGKLLVAMGAHAWRFLGGPEPFTDWRGFISPTQYQGIHVFATVHLADLYRDPKLAMATMRDYIRIGQYLKGEWPRTLPDSIIASDIDIDRMLWWFDEAYKARFVAIDTEYNPVTRELYLVGMGFIGGPTLQIRYNSCQAKTLGMWVREFRKLVQQVPCVFQNALADVPILRDAQTWRYAGVSSGQGETLGIDWTDYRQIDDTMQAHHCLWSELPHDLEFLASIYGKYNKMKHLAKTDPLVYNQGDVVETIEVWLELEKELYKDPLTKKVYREQHIRLLPIIDESMGKGIAVNRSRVESAYASYKANVEEAQWIAWAYTGWPINLGSDDQMGHWLYDIEGEKEQTAKRKKKGEKPTKSRTVNEDAIAVLRGKWLDVDPDEAITVPNTIQRIEQGGHPLLEAKVLYTGASHAISNYLKPLMTKE